MINKAHINGTKIHPNTYLYKILNLADLLHANDPKFEQAWGEIGDNCRQKLRPYNPQIMHKWNFPPPPLAFYLPLS